MPTLANRKHERFALELYRGLPQGRTKGQCYTASGYRAYGKSAEVCATRLFNNVALGIARRLAELQERTAKRAGVTVDSLVSECDEARDLAIDERLPGAALQATNLKGKLTGRLIERTEIGGPGAFDRCESVADFAMALLNDYGDGITFDLETKAKATQLMQTFYDGMLALVDSVRGPAPAPTYKYSRPHRQIPNLR